MNELFALAKPARRTLLISVLGAMGGCHAFTEPAEYDALVDVEQVGWPPEPAQVGLPPLLTVVEANVVVTGLFPVPTPCHVFRAPVVVRGTRVSIFVESQERPVDCVAADQLFEYHAAYQAASDLTRVTVYHGQLGRRADAVVVLDTSFVSPN